MRIVGEVNHPECKITFLHWNNRYLIKVERDWLEQVFKISQFDLTDEQDLVKITDESFIEEAMKRFDAMNGSLSKAMEKL